MIPSFHALRASAVVLPAAFTQALGAESRASTGRSRWEGSAGGGSRGAETDREAERVKPLIGKGYSVPAGSGRDAGGLPPFDRGATMRGRRNYWGLEKWEGVRGRGRCSAAPGTLPGAPAGAAMARGGGR